MRFKLIILILFLFSSSIYSQEFENGSIITQRYDTITNVKVKKISDSKSLLHITYIDTNGEEQNPDIESIKYYTRGNEIFTRIYSSGEMILVKQLTSGKKLNLFERDYNGSKVYYVEKVFDETIKVPSSKGKFKKVLSAFLDDTPHVSEKIKSEELSDINEIVTLYNNM